MDAVIETAKTIGITIAEIILVVYFCVKYINAALRKEDISRGVKEQSNLDLQIIEKMDYYKELLGADRIFLFEFHNGQHYSNYRTALKMSPSYEVFRAGYKSKMAECSNLPISIMPKLIYEITHNGHSECSSIEDIKNDKGNTYEFKKSIDVQSYYDVAIRDREHNIIGFVAVEWATDRPEDIDINQINKLAWFLEDKVQEIVKESSKKKKGMFKNLLNGGGTNGRK